MLRRVLAARPVVTDPVRWRSDQPNRIESVSDAVFGFAITLLVLSLEVPRTYQALVDLMWGVPAFFFSFLVLGSLWWRQCRFFRRYGLADRQTALLNGALLFLVTVYVYPLKFLFDLAFSNLFGLEQGHSMLTSYADERGLLTIYGAGFASVLGVLALMYLHAYRLRDALELAPAEARHTLGDAIELGIGAAGGCAMIGLAFALPAEKVLLAQLVLLTVPLARLLRRRLARAPG
jgi:hypothetical protein